VLLPLLAGAGVGVAVLALGTPESDQSNADWWRLFFEGSTVGLLIVVAGLALLITRSNGFERRSALPQMDN
jgi:hypothetical protein